MIRRGLEGPSCTWVPLRFLLGIHLFILPQLAFDGEQEEGYKEEGEEKKERERRKLKIEREGITRIDYTTEPLLHVEYLVNTL